MIFLYNLREKELRAIAAAARRDDPVHLDVAIRLIKDHQILATDWHNFDQLGDIGPEIGCRFPCRAAAGSFGAVLDRPPIGIVPPCTVRHPVDDCRADRRLRTDVGGGSFNNSCCRRRGACARDVHDGFANAPTAVDVRGNER